MKKSTHILIASILAGCITSCSSGKRIAQHRIVTNPMNLNYRFQPKDESRREAADPVLEYFKGYYYRRYALFYDFQRENTDFQKCPSGKRYLGGCGHQTDLPASRPGFL